jgi:hypothetical protein
MILKMENGPGSQKTGISMLKILPGPMNQTILLYKLSSWYNSDIRNRINEDRVQN